MVYLGVAEKRRPHFDLTAIRLAFSEGKGLYTRTALVGAAALGCGRREIDGIIGTILPGHFYKSMTSKHDDGFSKTSITQLAMERNYTSNSPTTGV
jgi:hypothetical protein